MYIPKTLTETVKYYAGEQTCIDAVASLRWPNGIPVCPKCGVEEGDRKHYWLATQKRWKCYACRKQFSVKVNSLFEDSPLGLDKWLIALWMLCNCKNGVSSHEIARELGIAQKSAWHLLHRLRSALQSPDEGETFVGGKVKNMHKSKKPKGTGITGKPVAAMAKTIVVGMLERTGRIRAEVVAERTATVLHGLVQKHIADGSTLMMDEWGGYKGTNLAHEIINHANEYVRGQVHTQGIENFWALLKRGLHRKYISVEPFHLFRYIDEQAFRYEHRATKDKPYTNAGRRKETHLERPDREGGRVILGVRRG